MQEPQDFVVIRHISHPGIPRGIFKAVTESCESEEDYDDWERWMRCCRYVGYEMK
jgi:hypothetical protein